MPWPRRSKATSRNSSASALSYCLAQQRWFCDQPWMNRIGGPSALPHSRTCSRRPPPPSHRVNLHPPGPRLLAVCDRCHLSPPRARRIDAIVARARSRSASGGEPYLRPPAYVSSAARCYERLPSRRWRRDTGRMEARASEAFVGRARELGELERALDATRAGRGATVLVAGEAGIGKTRLASELASRARAAGFEVLLGRSIDLVGTELPVPAVRRGPASARRASAGRRAGARARSCACSRRRSRCSPSAQPPHPCCSCSRICTGPTRRRSISSSSSRTTSTTGGFCCSRPTARTSSRRPSACAASPTASGARARRSCSSSGRSSTRS